MCLYANGRASPAENRRFEVRILVGTRKPVHSWFNSMTRGLTPHTL